MNEDEDEERDKERKRAGGAILVELLLFGSARRFFLFVVIFIELSLDGSDRVFFLNQICLWHKLCELEIKMTLEEFREFKQSYDKIHLSVFE